jgi:DNA-binding response OmpR family regulator
MSTHVLVVEDDSDFAESVSANLEYAGYGVSGIARTGLEAFQLCEKRKPDVALIDIGLEGAFDGIFLGEQLAERGIAVIYLTGRFDRALKEGREHAAGLLAKPCSLADLTAAIDAAMAPGPPKQRASS